MSLVIVRNKYCYMCQYNDRKNIVGPKPHVCWKNYTGASTAMEADILVEGFQRSQEMHGLRYLSFIGDGDSSVYANLRENVSYGQKLKKGSQHACNYKLAFTDGAIHFFSDTW